MGSPGDATGSAYPEAALDDLLDELGSLQAMSPPPEKNRLQPPPVRRLPSYPSTESGGSPVRNWDSPMRSHPPLPPKPSKIPPPPPPRTSSKSPLVSPSVESSGAESSESANSQDGGSSRLSHRHQELLQKQRKLQEQYNRLQLIQHHESSNGGGNSHIYMNKAATLRNHSSSNDKGAIMNEMRAELKKTGSEGNLKAKLGLEFSAAPTGSLSNINKTMYETDIL